MYKHCTYCNVYFYKYNKINFNFSIKINNDINMDQKNCIKSIKISTYKNKKINYNKKIIRLYYNLTIIKQLIPR